MGDLRGAGVAAAAGVTGQDLRGGVVEGGAVGGGEGVVHGVAEQVVAEPGPVGADLRQQPGPGGLAEQRPRFRQRHFRRLGQYVQPEPGAEHGRHVQQARGPWGQIGQPLPYGGPHGARERPGTLAVRRPAAPTPVPQQLGDEERLAPGAPYQRPHRLRLRYRPGHRLDERRHVPLGQRPERQHASPTDQLRPLPIPARPATALLPGR
ncbi:hypothetical protein JHN46_46275, partial [Streptomyces sp. MBT33]|nr:hypothetical protein [Streptomyces sp. MBT33]